MNPDFFMPLPEGARFILDTLATAGHEGYCVGGCVRDALLGLSPKDYDICTDASPEEMQRIFASQRVIETGLQHGTLTVLYDGQPYEVTTYRIDGDYTDHRRPDSVIFVRELAQDLARRDFAVNAMAYNPQKGLIDLFDGQNDLKKRLIRCVGEAHRRFDEDALRILRALRFAAVYDFDIEAETANAAHELCPTLSHVAKERITVEFSKLVCGQAAQSILQAHANVLSAVLPCVLHTDGLSETPAKLPLRLAHVLQDVQEIKAVLSLLRFDNATAQAVTELIAQKDAEMPASDAEWKLMLHKLGQERTLQLSAWKKWNSESLQAILARGDCWNLKMLAVTGKDLMAVGVPKGKQVGIALERLLMEVIKGSVCNTKEALLHKLHSFEKSIV